MRLCGILWKFWRMCISCDRIRLYVLFFEDHLCYNLCENLMPILSMKRGKILWPVIQKSFLICFIEIICWNTCKNLILLAHKLRFTASLINYYLFYVCTWLEVSYEKLRYELILFKWLMFLYHFLVNQNLVILIIKNMRIHIQHNM